jgi:hypothetical protein
MLILLKAAGQVTKEFPTDDSTHINGFSKAG